MSESFSLFYEKEVEFQVGEINLRGTLSIPRKGENFPAVILLSGYGPCTRDYEERGMKKFRIISSYLAKNGIAVLRFDDRGVGESSDVNWSQFTFYDLSDEALSAFRLLKAEKDINSNKIGFLGHSLGAAIAPLAASSSEEVAFIILLGGHGLVGTKTGVITRKSLGQVMGETNDVTEKRIELVKRIYAILLSNEDNNRTDSLVYEELNTLFKNLPTEEQNKTKTVENYLEATYEGFLLSEGNTPMFKSFLNYDPSFTLSKVKCPSLVLFAGLDIMHPPDQHMDAMRNDLNSGGSKNFDIEVFSQADHGFATEESRKHGSFIPELLPMITDWIKKNI